MKRHGGQAGLRDIRPVTFWLLVAAVIGVKCLIGWLQMAYVWVDGAPLDDELMFRAAVSIREGNWLGGYDWLTLSKHMFFAIWLAFCNLVGLPYLVAGQLLVCLSSLAASFAVRPLLKRRLHQLLLFVLLAFQPATTAAFTLRVYRDNIFPSLCMLFFAGMCGYALRVHSPLKKGLPWLLLAGVGLATAWLCREDGIWLLPFALVGGVVLAILAILEQKTLAQRCKRIAVLLVPFGVLAAGIGAYSGMNQAVYGVFTVSDFSSGSFSEAMGAMNRVKPQQWKPLVSVPQEVRQELYQAVPLLQPLEYWLEEDADLQNSYRNPGLHDYQAGSFYWAIRKAAWMEGVYESPQTANRYWSQVAEQINQLCDTGALPSQGGKRVGTTPPFRMEYLVPVLQETVASLWHTITFQDCQPYMTIRSIGRVEDLAVWEDFLHQKTNHAAAAGQDAPYYNSVQKMVFGALELVRYAYVALLVVDLVLAVVLQVQKAMALAKSKATLGDWLPWILLLGLLGMALMRCAMIAFMEVAAFQIGTYVMYLSTVHPLLVLYSGVSILSVWRNEHWQNS